MKEPSDHDLLIQLNQKVSSIAEDMKRFVDHREFYPIKVIVYGMASVIFTGFLLAICGLVFRHFSVH